MHACACIFHGGLWCEDQDVIAQVMWVGILQLTVYAAVLSSIHETWQAVFAIIPGTSPGAVGDSHCGNGPA